MQQNCAAVCALCMLYSVCFNCLLPCCCAAVLHVFSPVHAGRIRASRHEPAAAPEQGASGLAAVARHQQGGAGTQQGPHGEQVLQVSRAGAAAVLPGRQACHATCQHVQAPGFACRGVASSSSMLLHCTVSSAKSASIAVHHAWRDSLIVCVTWPFTHLCLGRVPSLPSARGPPGPWTPG
jgi:hypothetical protein